MGMDIKILAPEVIDQIAAGEVVERPSHLVKELLENSLDALADKIELDVDLGGRKIKVADNGIGISKDDLPLVCARHATSKIAKADDLWSLHTFGFRGEALASISSVSRLKVVSKKRDEAQAFMLENNYGAASEPLLTGAGEGTTIEVDELFTNVPARLKFLKSDSAEVTQIKSVVKALALANPTVEFKFKQQGKVSLFYPRDADLASRAMRVLDTPELFPIAAEHMGYRLEGVIGSPNTTTGNSKQIWIFVQNRWVSDRTVQAAVMESYRSLLMHGEFPFAVIKITAPDGEVDVNIHPTKSQVKFTDQSFVFRLVHGAVRAELERAPWIGNLSRSSQTAVAAEPVPVPLSLAFQDSGFEQTQYAKKSFVTVLRDIPSPTFDSPSPDFFAKAPPVEEAVTSEGGFWSRLDVLGQSHLTYILAEGQNSLFLVDQHAAHERVVFEKLMEGWKNGRFEVQGFLLPISIDLGPEQVEALLGLKNEFTRMGLEIEQGGPETLLISSSPGFVSEKALVSAIKKFADDVVQLGGSFSFEKKVADIFATMACHSVVRAGQALSTEEMRALLRQMDEFRLSSYCPHGRNVYVELPFTKIEKDFGRIP